MKFVFILALTFTTTMAFAKDEKRCASFPPQPTNKMNPVKFVSNGIAHAFGNTPDQAYWALHKNIEKSPEDYFNISYSTAVKKPLNLSQVNIVRMKDDEAGCEVYYAMVSVNSLAQ